jgi:hypothetical protein
MKFVTVIHVTLILKSINWCNSHSQPTSSMCRFRTPSQTNTKDTSNTTNWNSCNTAGRVATDTYAQSVATESRSCDTVLILGWVPQPMNTFVASGQYSPNKFKRHLWYYQLKLMQHRFSTGRVATDTYAQSVSTESRYLFLQMHGLVFKASIRLRTGSTRLQFARPKPRNVKVYYK